MKPNHLRISTFLFAILLFSIPARATMIDRFFVEIGPAGIFQFDGDHRKFDPAPGFLFNAGYRWQALGLRTSFLVGAMEEDPAFRIRDDHEMVGWSLNLLFYPMSAAGESDYPFQPYIFGGPGVYVITEGDAGADDDSAGGVAGLLGWGFDFEVIDHLSLGFEQGFHFVGFVEDNQPPQFFPEDQNGFEAFFISIAGKITYHF